MAVYFDDDLVKPDPFYKYTSSFSDPKMSIIIDNGSYNCRAGWAHNENPMLTFKPISAKFKSKKTSVVETLTGNSISATEQTRLPCKSAFEKGVVTQFEIQEQIFDYIFEHLQIKHAHHIVNHPIVITEPLCNPSYCRQKMSELLFECYGVPSIVYGVDSLFSLYYNNNNNGKDDNNPNNNNNNKTNHSNTLVISFGYNACHITPIVDGRVTKCRRFNFGGGTLDWLMMRCLQLKYPCHLPQVTLPRAEQIVQQHCSVSEYFEEELMKWVDGDYYHDHVTKYQLPFNQATAQKVAAEKQKEKQEEQARKLREMNLKRRRNKLATEQSRLDEYMSIMEMIREEEDEEEEGAGLQNQAVVNILENHHSSTTPQNILENHHLASVADLRGVISTLQATVVLLQEGIEKICQDENVDGQSKAKKAKFEKSKYVTAPPIGDESAMAEWIAELRRQRKEILDEDMKKKKNAKNEVRSGRRSYASVQRMRVITQLSSHTVKDEDDKFGWDDDDWNIYKGVEEGRDCEDLDRLEEVEWCLQEFDPDFKKEETDFNIAEYHQLHVALEKIRIPELLMQPSIIGSSQAGVCEGIKQVLDQFDETTRLSLAQNIFLTGACSTLAGMVERVAKEVRQTRPCETEVKVKRASNGVLDAWRGARMVGMDGGLVQEWGVTRGEWLEEGEDVFKESPVSNRLLRKVV